MNENPYFQVKVIYFVSAIKLFLFLMPVLLLLLYIPSEVRRWVRDCVVHKCHLYLNQDSPFRKRKIVVLVGSISSQEIIFLLKNYSINKCIFFIILRRETLIWNKITIASIILI